MKRPLPHPPAGSMWLHYKGGRYVVLGVATNTHPSSTAWMVVYHPEDRPYELYLRSLTQWHEMVQPEGLNQFIPRFQLITLSAHVIPGGNSDH